MSNVVAVLQNWVQKHPDQDAILYLEDGEKETARLSYAELDHHAKIIAAFLHTNKMTDNCVMLLYPPGTEFIASLLGCWYAGVIAVPIHCPKLDEFEKNQSSWNSIVEDANISAVLTLDAYCFAVQSLLEVPVVATNTLNKKIAQKYKSVSINEETIAYLQYTSGSTALPKAAIVTHGNLQHSLKELIKAWHYTKSSITLNWAPHTHVYGLVCGLLLPLYHGSLAIIISPLAFINRPLIWLSAISKYRVSHSGCPNFGYDLCVKHIQESESKDLDLKHWKVAINGGDLVHSETLKAFVNKFHSCGFELKQFCSAYGMSELTGAIAVTPFSEEPKFFTRQSQSPLVSSGKLLGGLEAIIVDPQTGLPVAPGDTGEIWISGKSVVCGYWGRPEEYSLFHAKVAGNETTYFKTGDLGFIFDEEIYLTGRLKEVIIVYGKKYYPLDLEHTIAQAVEAFQLTLPQVVFSIEHEDSHKIVAVQEISEEINQTLLPKIKDTICHAITKRYGINLHELILTPKGSIPKTVSGKLQRRKTRHLFNEKKISPLIQEKQLTKTSEAIGGDTDFRAQNKFIDLVAETLQMRQEQIDLHAPLSRYSFDSVTITRLTTLLNETYQLSLSPANLYEYSTLAEFYTDLINKRLNEKIENTYTDRDIAVIGMSGVFPLASNLLEFWENLSQGKDCISEIPSSRWDLRELTVKWGGFIDGLEEFDAEFFNISPREAELIDPQQRLFLQTVWHTIEDAGYTTETLAHMKTGLFVGVSNHDYAELLQKNKVMDAYLTTGTMNSIIANRISYFLNLHGPSEVIDTACSSSLVAIHQAIQAILHKDCDVAIAGGVNALITPTSFISASKALMLSEEGRCKTFDKNADGYVRSEGSGAIFLKKLSSALADGDYIYGVIKGSAVNHGGHVNTLTAPNPNAQAEVVISACQRARVGVDTIQYIETHGTGTPLGDPIEINGLKKAFHYLATEQKITQLPKHYCGLGAVKTNIGHLESAAGIAGVIKVLLSMHYESIPSNLHLKEQNAYINITDSPFYLINETVEWPRKEMPRRAGVSSFGFGGVNAHILLEERPKQKKVHTPLKNSAYLVTLSALTESALQQRIHDLVLWLERQNHIPDLASLSYTLNKGRTHFEKRFCLIAETIDQLKEQLKSKKPIPSSFDQLNQIRIRYLKGESINWDELYDDYQQKIPLPGYPFTKKSYWIKEKNKNSLYLHELIDEHNAELTVFSKQFTGNEFYFLGHQVHDESVLPAAVGLEMVRIAGNMVNQNVTEFCDIQWKKPIKSKDLIYPIQVHLNGTSFVITNQNQFIEYVTGKIKSSKSHIKEPPLNFKELKHSLSVSQTPQEIYTYFNHAGLFYGSTFQVIHSLHHNDHHLLAELRLPSFLEGQFVIHPCLFDGILQTTQALLKNRNILYLPFSMKRLVIYKPIPQNCYVYAQLVAQNEEFPTFNIQVTDSEGEFVLSITEFSLAASHLHHLKTDTSMLGYYHPVWVECPNPELDSRGLEHEVQSGSRKQVAKRRDLSGSFWVLGSHELAQAIQIQFDKPKIIHRQDFSNIKIDVLTDYVLIELEKPNYFLFQEIAKDLIQLKPKHPVQIVCLSRRKLTDSYAIAGFAKTLHQEQSNISCRIIELQDFKCLAYELTQNEIQVRYNEQNKRLVIHYHAILESSENESSASLKTQGVYLITGGLGKIGTLVAHYLASHYQARLILSGRSKPSKEQLQWISDLERIGASVFFVAADISRQQDVHSLIKQGRAHFGEINGIIHAAGLIEDGLIITKTSTKAAPVLAPKIQGTIYLHEATRRDRLDFFVLFSSVAAVFGNAGQSDYAYANGFMDDFAQNREQQKLKGGCFGKTLSINWPFWEEGGLKLASEYQQELKKNLGIECLSTSQGLEAFAKALRYNITNCIVLPGNQRQLTQALYQNSVINKPTQELFKPDQSSKTQIEEFLKKILSEVLKSDPELIDVNAPFEQYGVDSLMIIQLNERLQHLIPDLPKTLFFEYKNLSELIDYFATVHANEFSPKSTELPTELFDIAIIGLSGHYPQAKNLNEFWENLKSGKDCITEIPSERWAFEDYFDKNKDTPGTMYSKWGGFLSDVDKFDPLFFKISPGEAALIDPQERLFLETAWEAVEDAGYAQEQLAGKKVGVYVGVMYGEYQLFANQDSFVPTHSLFSAIANRVSYFFDFHGPSIALDTMCSSSLTAIHLACQSLKTGECQLALAGGVNLSLHPNKYLLLSHGKFLASNGHCRSFGSEGDGYVPGEGVGAVLLKPLSKALEDGDSIYGVIKGSTLNHGGKTNGYTVPNPNAQAELIASAYQNAHIDPAAVSYIEAHGTGTSLGDPIEIAGLNKVFSHLKNYQCPIGSVKSNIGHCESAAGIAALTKVLLQLKHKTLVPSIFSEPLNNNINWSETPFKVQQTLSPWNGFRIAGISSFGAGGSNAHLIVTEAPEMPLKTYSEKPYYLLTFSGKTEDALTQRISDLLDWMNKNKSTSFADLSYTLNARRSHFEHRASLVASSFDEAIEILQGKQSDRFFIQLKKQEIPTHVFMEQLRQPEQYHEALIALAKAYVHGNTLDWETLHEGESKRKITLPSYPFAKERCWYSEDNQEKNNQKPYLGFSHSINSFLVQQVMQILKMNKHQIDLEKNLGDYGMDSIHFIELAKRIATQYQIDCTPAIFYTANSILSISRYLINNYNMASDSVIKNQHNDTLNPTLNTSKSHQNDNQLIAIIGMHGMFPQSANPNEFWQHLIEGHDLITEIPKERWDWHGFYGQDPDKSNSKWGGFIKDMDQFDAGFFNISPREANFMDPQQRLFLETVWYTIEDAGYNPFELASQKVGVFAGVEFSEYQTLIAKEHKEFYGFIATGNSHSMIPNRVSYFFNFQGPSEAIDTACSSSLVAIHRAAQSIVQGECDLAIAGGVSLILNPDTLIITSQMGALSPEGRCKTFDKTADGYVKGEGVASLLLKPLSQAQADGDSIYAIIKGSSVNHGGKAQSLTAPNAAAQGEVLRNAYKKANIGLDTITYIETHGTGTSLGDPIEIEGLKQVFTLQTKARIALGSVKTNIGHLEPASGIAGVMKVILAMQHQKIPGILHLKELNPYIKLEDTPFYIAQKNQVWKRLKDESGLDIPLRAGISSFGFGGTNAHMILEEGSTQPIPVKPKPYYLITLSAKQLDSLQQKIKELHQWLSIQPEEPSLAALSFTLNAGRAHFIYRCALVVASIEELSNALSLLIEQEIPEFCIMNEGQVWSIKGPVLDAVYQTILSQLNQNSKDNLLTLADLYTKNYPIDWQLLYDREEKRRMHFLPSYPFVKQRHWYDLELIPASTSKAVHVDFSSSVLDYLRQIFAEQLGIVPDRINADETYEVYGVDSVIGLGITTRLEKDFGTLPKTLLYERNRLRDLANYFIKNHQEKLSSLISGFVPTSEITTSPESTSFEPSVLEKNQDIAIIGLTGTFPMANTMDEFWQNLVSGQDCITEIPQDRWDYKAYPVLIGDKEHYFSKGGFIPDVDKFDPLFFNISPRDAGIMDPQERLFLQSAWSTLEDAGYTRETIKNKTNNSVGVFAGVTYNFYPLFSAEEWQKGNRVPLDIQSFSVANRVSYFLDVNGPSFVVDTACSSSLTAIHLACESIIRGECAMAIAGGINLSLHPSKYHFLGSFNFMSEEGRCASFAEGGSGYVPAEGVGTVLLKPLEQAVSDNDLIYGVIKASSINHGGKTSGYTVPNPNAQAAVILKALKTAHIDPATISYVEAHGTGTSLGDPIEIRGLQEAFEVFTQEKQYCAIGSVKSNIGHLESAAGISQLAKVLLQMHYKKLVPTLHTERLNAFIDFKNSPFYVQRDLSEWPTKDSTPRRAGISSFGAGGANVHMIVEEYIPPIKEPETLSRDSFFFVLSALNEERLTAYVHRMYDYFKKNEHPKDPIWLRNVCYTLQVGRESMRARFAAHVRNKEDLLSALEAFPNPIDHKSWINLQAESHVVSEQIPEEELAQQWVNGVKIDWQIFYAKQTPSLLSLPTYPFAKRRCWIQIKEEGQQQNPPEIKPETPPAKERVDFKEWLYAIQWEKNPHKQNPNPKNEGKWLIVSDHELGLVLQQELSPQSCIYCFSGTEYSQIQEQVYYINPEQKKDYELLFQTLYQKHKNEITGIIYLCPQFNILEKQDRDPSLALLYLFQSMIQFTWNAPLIFALISQSAQRIIVDEVPSLEQHHLWSMTRIFGAEQANYQVTLIDLDKNQSLHENARLIVTELNHVQANQNHVAYRANERYTIRFNHAALTKNHAPSWKTPTAILITGGLGALGSELAQFFISQGTRFVLLTGITELSEQTLEKNACLKQLESKGAQVRYASVDVTHQSKMQELIQDAQNTWHCTLDAVFHLAGMATDNLPIANIDESLWKQVLQVKIKGALVLHELFKNSELSYFVLFSSIAAIPHFGMSGLSAYAVANEFLNGLALYRRSLKLPAMSINWVAWSEKGMSHRYHHDDFLNAVGMASLSIKEGIRLLASILILNPAEITVCKIQWNKFFQVNPGAKKLDFFKHFVSEESSVTITSTLDQTQITTLVKELLASVLALSPSEIDTNIPFQNYGMDSITGIRYTEELGKHFPELVSPMDLYRYPTLHQLTEFIIQRVSPSLVEEKTKSSKEEVNLDELNYEQLNELIESELKELELAYE
jgi:polyketide synthase PksL